MLTDAVLTQLERAVRSGALKSYGPDIRLDEGEWLERKIWMRPDVDRLLKPGFLADDQLRRVLAALRRFLTGGEFTVLTAETRGREVSSLGDIRELKGAPPPFIELRFRPPKHHLRVFGRFIAKDCIVLTSNGSKSLLPVPGQRPLSVADHRRNCDLFFSRSLSAAKCPSVITQCLTKAVFV